MKKVLIIGACGFVGEYLIKELKNNNYKVFACDLNKNQNVENEAKFYELDITKKEQVEEIIENIKPNYIINLAAISSVGLSWNIPEKTINVNVIGTINILEAVHKKCPKCKILLIGSAEEYAPKMEPLKEEDTIIGSNPYGISKIAQENFARLYKEKYGLNIVCTRSFNHTGIGQQAQFVIPSFCKQVAQIENSNCESGKIYVGNLSAYRDFSDVKDIVKVYRLLLENETEEMIYNVGSGNTYKVEDLLKYIISLSSKQIEIVVDKNKMRPIDIPYICCDNTKISKYFDNTDIKETIKEMYEYFKKEDENKTNK